VEFADGFDDVNVLKVRFKQRTRYECSNLSLGTKSLHRNLRTGELNTQFHAKTAKKDAKLARFCLASFFADH